MTEQEIIFCDDWIPDDEIETLILRNDATPTEFRFHGSDGQTIAIIDKDGIFRVKVDPSDENTQEFIRLVNHALAEK